MKWVSSAVLYILSIILLLQEPLYAAAIVAMLAVLLLFSVTELTEKRVVLVISCAVWTVMCLLMPVYCLFWPLLVLEVGVRRAYPLAVLPVVCICVQHAAFPPHVLIALSIGTACALLLGMYDERYTTLKREILVVRDTSMERNIELDRKNRELMEAQDYEVRIATLAERGRIAREIHDNVGHMLSRAMLQTGAAMALARDDATRQNLDGLKDTLTHAMNSVRQSVHDLRDNAFDLRDMVQAAVRDFSSYECTVHYDMPADIPQEIQYCFAAIVREGFSNMRRHSNATRVRIDMQEHPAFYRLQFEDNGSTRQKMEQKPGMGLDNMRERAQMLGGQFYTSSEKGFRIHVTIPRQKGEQT